MKHVGEAVKDFGLATSSQNPVVVIGIAPWGCIQNRELLIEEEVRITIDPFHRFRIFILTLKAPITTAADDKFCDIFPNF